MDMASSMIREVSTSTSIPTSTRAMVMSTAFIAVSSSPAAMSMSMGSGTCKLSMLLNWTTIDACFLFPSFQIRSSFGFFATCLGAFVLVITLEFLRRLQRQFDTYLRARNKFVEERKYLVAEEEIEEKLLKRDGEERDAIRGGNARDGRWRVVFEQTARGAVHSLQFAVSYFIMLLFMYSNGYIIISILFGALVGSALFTRDTLYSRSDTAIDEPDKSCC